METSSFVFFRLHFYRDSELKMCVFRLYFYRDSERKRPKIGPGSKEKEIEFERERAVVLRAGSIELGRLVRPIPPHIVN